MKKLMATAIGLGLAIGPVAFAQQNPAPSIDTSQDQGKKKKKGKKKKSEDKMPSTDTEKK